MLRAYFDESGSSGNQSGYFVLCGYLATEEAWGPVDSKIDDLLQNPCFYPVTIKDETQRKHACRPLDFLHATEMHGPGKERFRRIGHKNRQRLVRESVHLCCSKEIKGIGSGVVLKEYYALDEKAQAVIGEPYALCFQHVIQQTAEQATKLLEGNPEEKIDFVFEENPIYRNTLGKLWDNMSEQGRDRYRMSSVSFAQKAEFRPLQLADRFAFEATKHLTGTTDRQEWKQLVKSGNHYGEYFGHRGIRDLRKKLAEDGLL